MVLLCVAAQGACGLTYPRFNAIAGSSEAATAHGSRGTLSASPELTLTTVKAIHELSAAQAADHRKLHLKGVVTTVSTWPNAFFFQDATGGISIENAHPTGAYNGVNVEVEGETAAGLFAPIVQTSRVRVFGPGKMPRARVFTYPELTGGAEDSQWIAIRGIIRSAKMVTVWEQQVLTLMVEVNGGLVTVKTTGYAGTDLPGLVDAVVRLQGVCTTSFNDKRQFTGIGLDIPSMAYAVIEKRPAPDPFSLAAVPVRNLLQFHPGLATGHRVQVTGTVTYQDPGHSLYLQDGSDGILVETEQTTPVALGTRIAAVGFPASGTYSPILREASFRVQYMGMPAMAASIQSEDFLRQGKFITAPYDAQLVQIRGQIVETTERLNDTSWLLRDGDKHFEAILHRAPREEMPIVESGSMVAITGIFSVQVDESRQPTSFRVMLRSPADLQVVKRASWWTPGHALAVVSAMLIAIFAVALWGILLRRTVRQQTRMLRESEERFRIQAHQDALTGLVSRSFLQEQLEGATERARRDGETIGLLMIDLDHFKQVNDTLGHHAGDELLCLVAERIRGSVRKGDTVARMGGDEFIVLLQQIDGCWEAELIGAKIVANVSAPVEIGGLPVLVSASVGVCVYPEGGTDPGVLLRHVDAAMYKAKAAGRNSFSVYGKHSPNARETVQLLTPAGS